MPDALRFADVTERAIYLRSIPVAAELPPHVVHVIASLLVPRRFDVGDRLMRAGETFQGLELLTEGRVGLSRGDAKLGQLAPPQSLGFLDILTRSAGSYDAVAIEPTRSMLLDTEVFYELMEEHPPLLHATIRYAADRLLYEMQELPAEMLGFPDETIPFEVPADRPLDLVERILFLRVLSTFKKTNVNALAAMAQQIEEVRIPAGADVFRRGEPSTSGYMLVKGHIECFNKDGKRFRYGPGTAVGGVESIAAKPRWYDAKAEDDIVALLGSTDEFFDLFEENFGMATDFLTMLAGGLKGLLARKAAMGQSMTAQKRDVSSLGAVPVGA
jgi:CRP-like cAMP-binding protein